MIPNHSPVGEFSNPSLAVCSKKNVFSFPTWLSYNHSADAKGESTIAAIQGNTSEDYKSSQDLPNNGGSSGSDVRCRVVVGNESKSLPTGGSIPLFAIYTPQDSEDICISCHSVDIAPKPVSRVALYSLSFGMEI